MKDKTKRLLITLGHFFVVIVLICLDQISKLHIRTYLSDGSEITVIKGVLKIVFVKNTGAVWGILKGFTNVLSYSSILILIIVLIFYIRLPKSIKKYRPLTIVSLFVMGGAVGNLIDRIFLKYVVDFIYFELIDFPVFNIADCYITVSLFVLIFLFVFYYKDDDLSFISKKSASADEDNTGDYGENS